MDFVTGSRSDLSVPFRDGAHPTALWHYPARSGSARADRRPVLLIHGFRGDHHGLSFIAHHLRTRDAYIPDLPGFGQTPPLPGGLTLAGYLDLLDGLVTAVTSAAGAPPLVIGHSFGSILTANWAARTMSRTDRAQTPTASAAAPLILLNPIVSPALEGTNRILTRAAQAYYWAGQRLPERAGTGLLSSRIIVRLMSEVMAASRDPGLRAFIHDQHRRHFSTFSDRRSLAEAFDVSIRHTVAEAAAALTMPVTIVAGRDDEIAPLPATEAFGGALSDARLVVFDGVGHLTHYERPEQIAALIDAAED
ncbi:alpha/beta fold hydrolase [Brevibacterium otitidis]|uniref:Alpha/beta fold hydrolase n=1 Tax=Brevibacterium otitidis TaxID=53364 RepID=A0ABV5WZP1_9MICO|nr:alpha/beta hydrolase [Brevibacterium otitidis]